MSNFLSNLGSLYWWLSVVVVGLIINFTGNFISKHLDKYYSKLSDRRFVKKESLQKAFEDDVAHLLANPHEQLLTVAAETNIRSQALDNGVKSVLFIVLGLGISPMQSMDSASKVDLVISLILMLGGLVFMILSFSHNSKAHKLNYLLSEVIKRSNAKS